jgi:chromosome segregation ATPase
VQKLVSDKESVSAAITRQLQAELQDTHSKLAESEATLDKLQRRKAAEMEHVEQRVKAAIQRKDETIGALRAQLAEAHASMRSTEQMLAAESGD